MNKNMIDEWYAEVKAEVQWIFEMFNVCWDSTTRPPLPASWEICIQVKKHQLELDMEK